MAFYEIGKTLRLNRECNGHTLETLSEGICSPQTLYRIEKGRSKVKMEYYDAFLSKLQQCQERDYTLYIGDTPQIMELKTRVDKACSVFEYERARELLKELEILLGAGAVTRQYIASTNVMIENNLRIITAEQYIRYMEDALAITVDRQHIRQRDMYPFRAQELEIMMNIASKLYETGKVKESHECFRRLIRVLNHRYSCGNRLLALKAIALRNYALLYHKEQEYKKARALEVTALNIMIRNNYGRHIATVLESLSCSFFDDDAKNNKESGSKEDRRKGRKILEQAIYVASAYNIETVKDILEKSYKRKYAGVRGGWNKIIKSSQPAVCRLKPERY